MDSTRATLVHMLHRLILSRVRADRARTTSFSSGDGEETSLRRQAEAMTAGLLERIPDLVELTAIKKRRPLVEEIQTQGGGGGEREGTRC